MYCNFLFSRYTMASDSDYNPFSASESSGSDFRLVFINDSVTTSWIMP